MVVCQGSVSGTLCEVVDLLRGEGLAVGVLSIVMYRPFPGEAVSEQLCDARRVVVVDRAFPTGGTGFLFDDVVPVAPGPARCSGVVAGLGGRPVTRKSLARCLRAACAGELEDVTFLDLDRRVVERELEAL